LYESNYDEWHETIKVIWPHLSSPIQLKRLRAKFKLKYNEYLTLGYNSFMKTKKETRGRKPKVDNSDIPDLLDELTEEQLRELAKRYIEKSRNGDYDEKKKEMTSISGFSNTIKSKIYNVHRTTLYKKSKQRKYKYDYLKESVVNIIKDSNGAYGSRRICVVLKSEHNITIGDRTHRKYKQR